MTYVRARLREGLVVALSTLAIAGAGFVFAAPTAPPPGSSISLPLTRGSTAETKTGPLTISDRLTVNELCLGGSCKTAWPSATIQSGSTTVTPGQQNFNYNSSYNYENNMQSYYTYGNNVYTSSNGGYYLNPQTFSISTPISVTGVPITATPPTVRCYSTNSNYTFNAAYCGTYCSSNTFTYATNVVTTVSGNSVIVSGSCRFYGSGTYGVAKPDQMTVTYLY